MATANALITRLETPEPTYRVAPSNIDAEQALLGAILVNNDAYYRVSDFLEAGHFMEDLHRRVYEVATTVINAEDYGRTIYDLAVRRNLITIGEDLVNVAYDAPVESSPREQIEE